MTAFRDARRTNDWEPLGVAVLGEGTQSGARKPLAFAMLPLTVPADAVGVTIGTAVYWIIAVPTLILWGVGAEFWGNADRGST